MQRSNIGLTIIISALFLAFFLNTWGVTCWPVRFERGRPGGWVGLQRAQPWMFAAVVRQMNKVSSDVTDGDGDRSVRDRVDPEVYMNVSELISSKGYPVEEYTVETRDGFLLGVQRIPHGRHGNHAKSRPVVFLQHGLLCSSTNWVTNLANESLGFLLADAGFDVWLGNDRGNTYSRRHKTLDPGEAKFWAWSWDEFAAEDLPAMINFTLATSGAKTLYYVGHSQGTLVAFAELSQSASFRDKVRMFFALGPVATVSHVKGPVRILAYLTPSLRTILNFVGVHEFLPNDRLMEFLASTFCDAPTRAICQDVIFLLAGFDTSNFNESRLPVYIGHSPAGTSVRNMVHFSQMVRSGRLQMYDYGSQKANQKHYKQPTPPLYDVTKVNVPVVLFSGDKDWLADVKDVDLLVEKLPQIVHHYRIPAWNHLDFIWGLDAATIVYDKIIAHIIRDHERTPDTGSTRTADRNPMKTKIPKKHINST